MFRVWEWNGCSNKRYSWCGKSFTSDVAKHLYARGGFIKRSFLFWLLILYEMWLDLVKCHSGESAAVSANCTDSHFLETCPCEQHVSKSEDCPFVNGPPHLVRSSLTREAWPAQRCPQWHKLVGTSEVAAYPQLAHRLPSLAVPLCRCGSGEHIGRSPRIATQLMWRLALSTCICLRCMENWPHGAILHQADCSDDCSCGPKPRILSPIAARFSILVLPCF